MTKFENTAHNSNSTWRHPPPSSFCEPHQALSGKLRSHASSHHEHLFCSLWNFEWRIPDRGFHPYRKHTDRHYIKVHSITGNTLAQFCISLARVSWWQHFSYDSQGNVGVGATEAWSSVSRSYPLQVFIFDHVELDVTEFGPFSCRWPLSFYSAAVAYDYQVCELCMNNRGHGYCDTVYDGCQYVRNISQFNKEMEVLHCCIFISEWPLVHLHVSSAVKSIQKLYTCMKILC